jgi:DNA primase large subunit
VDNRSSKGEVQGLSNNNRLQEELHHLSGVLVPDPCMHQLPSCTKQHRLPSNPGSPCNLCVLSHLRAHLLASLCTKQWLSSNHPPRRRPRFRLHRLLAKH